MTWNRLLQFQQPIGATPMPQVWERLAAGAPIAPIFTGQWSAGGFALPPVDPSMPFGVLPLAQRPVRPHVLAPHPAWPGCQGAMSRDVVQCISDGRDDTGSGRRVGIDGIPLDWSTRLRPQLMERAAAMRADREAWLRAATGRVEWFGAVIVAFPELPDAEGFAALRSALVAREKDVALVDLYLEQAEGYAADANPLRAQAYRFAAWAETVCLDRDDADAQHRFSLVAMICETIGSDAAEPAPFAAEHRFYAAVAELWPEVSDVRRAWDAYVTQLAEISADPVGAKKKARALPEIQNRITRALGQTGVDPELRWNERQRHKWEPVTALSFRQLFGAVHGKGDAVDRIAVIAHDYIQEGRRWQTEAPHRLLVPLGHGWSHICRALLVGGCPEVVEAYLGHIRAFEDAELRLAVWGGTVPQGRSEEWKQRVFLPVLWYRLAALYIQGADTQAIAWCRRCIDAAEEFVAWLSDQSSDDSVGVRQNELWWAFAKRQGKYGDAEVAAINGKPILAAAYAQVAEAQNAVIAWLRRQPNATKDALATDKHWLAIHSMAIHWENSAHALSIDQPILAQAYADAAEANGQYAAWYADSGTEEAGTLHYRITMAWLHIINALKENRPDIERMWRHVVTVNHQLLDRLASSLRAGNADERAKDPVDQLLMKEALSAAHGAQLIVSAPKGAAAWAAYVGVLRATREWYIAQCTDGNFPPAMQAEWERRRDGIDRTWQDLQCRYPIR